MQVQQHLDTARGSEAIAMAPHLETALAKSMIGESQPVSMVNGETVSSSEAVSIGLIVTAAVINALEHAFPPN